MSTHADLAEVTNVVITNVEVESERDYDGESYYNHTTETCRVTATLSGVVTLTFRVTNRDGVAHYDSDIVGECTDEEVEMIEKWFRYTDLDALGEAIVASDEVQDTMESEFDSAWSDAADDDYIRRNGLDAFYGVSGQF